MKLVILDRDGVINEDSDHYIKSPDEWQPIPGSIEALAHLHRLGYTVAVATNQSGIGRGYYSLDTLSAIHDKMNRLVTEAGGEIACIRFCPHLPQDNCNCRKPQPGLVHQIEEALNCSAKGAWFVGDTEKDIEVARKCGCRPVLVKTGKGQHTLEKCIALDPMDDVSIFADLQSFVKSFME